MANEPHMRPDAERNAENSTVIDATKARGGINTNLRYVLSFSTAGAIIVLALAYFGFFSPPRRIQPADACERVFASIIATNRSNR